MTDLIKIATLVIQLMLGSDSKVEHSKSPTGECYVDFYRNQRLSLSSDGNSDSLLLTITNEDIGIVQQLDNYGRVITIYPKKDRPTFSIQVQCD